MKKKVKVALDIMGGDYADVVPIEAAMRARRDGVSLVLVGNEIVIKNQLKNRSFDPKDFEIVDAPEVVKMEEELTTKNLRKKSSLRICYELLKDNKVQAMVSAGHSGIMMALGLLILRPIKGVDRPCIGVFMPRKKGKFLVADAGANIESSAKNIFQFAVLSSVYIEMVTGKNNPKLCLLNIGEEEFKGTNTLKSAYQMLKKSRLNFGGNLEGKNCFMGNQDALICDGLHGNLFIKTGEGAEKFIRYLLKEEVNTKFIYKLLAPINLIPIFKNVKKNTDYADSGGGVILGINGISIVCHGNSNVHAIYMALKNAENLAQNNFLDKMVKSIDFYQDDFKIEN